MITKKELCYKKENGQNIRGLAVLPSNSGKYPTVIFSHGFGSNFQKLQHYSDRYTKSGIACIFFDFCGGGPESVSDGTIKEMTILTEVQDLTEVLFKTEELNFVDKENIFLQGESQGGFVSALVAAAHSEKVKALLLWFPAFVIPDHSRIRFAEGNHTVFGLELSPYFDVTAMNVNVYEEITKYQNPVQLIHGDQDVIVPISYSQRAVGVYHDASLLTIQGAGHGFNGDDLQTAIDCSLHFIKKHL